MRSITDLHHQVAATSAHRVYHTPRASLASGLTCCFYSRTAFCPEATALRCFRCGVPACYRHLDQHVARCGEVAA